MTRSRWLAARKAELLRVGVLPDDAQAQAEGEWRLYPGQWYAKGPRWLARWWQPR